MLSEEVRGLHSELAQEQQARSDVERDCREKVNQMKEKLQKEKRLRTESNASLDLLTNKVKELENKYQNELWHYKNMIERQNSETYREKTVFENVTIITDNNRKTTRERI